MSSSVKRGTIPLWGYMSVCVCVCVWGTYGGTWGTCGGACGGEGGVPLFPDLQVVLCLTVHLAKCSKMAAASGPIAITIPL